MPPPSEAALRSQKWWRWILGVGIGLILFLLLVWMTTPVVIRAKKKSDLTEAVSNLRQIGLALFEFDADYGRFPDSSTAIDVKDATLTSLALGTTSSNDYFRQLIASEICQKEFIFYARTPTSKKPDNVFDGSNALEKGECAFAYIAGLSWNSMTETPVVVLPLVPGKKLFDTKVSQRYYDGKAVILRVDNRVIVLPIDKSGHVWLNGKDLFDPSQPFWGGKAPDVKWPE